MLKKLKYFFKNRKSASRKKLLGPHAKGVIYESKNGMIAMPVEDIAIGKELGFKGNWDIREVERLQQLLVPEDVVYIVGTHVGTLLVPVAKKVKQVVGYEANAHTFWFVTMNLCLNHLNNVKLFNKAAGNRQEKISFYQNTVNSGGSKIKPGTDTLQYTYDNPKTVDVDMVALDKHIASEKLPTPTAMIMDIEGAEYIALQGMQETIKNLKFLYIEYVAHHLKNIARVTNAEFLELILPHFKKAHCLRGDMVFNIVAGNNELLEHLNTLEAQDKTEDILFSN